MADIHENISHKLHATAAENSTPKLLPCSLRFEVVTNVSRSFDDVEGNYQPWIVPSLREFKYTKKDSCLHAIFTSRQNSSSGNAKSFKYAESCLKALIIPLQMILIR